MRTSAGAVPPGKPAPPLPSSSGKNGTKPVWSWYSDISRTGRLRTKFLFSLLLVSTSLTCSTLLVVRHRVELEAREQIRDGLQRSVEAFQQFQRQRETSLERSGALLANLPTLKSLMTSGDPLTIQDGSTQLWRTIGSDLFVLADRSGKLMALHTLTPDLARDEASELLQRSLRNGEPRDWWFGNGHLFQVFMLPIYFGEPASGTQLGAVVLGYEINRQLAMDVSRVASSQIAFRYGPTVVVSTLPAAQWDALQRHLSTPSSGADATPADLDLERERFLATSTNLSPGSALTVSLLVLKSYDQATAFLSSLNRWLAGLGLTAILAGSLLVYLISDTFTRPLANLVGGVHALEKGDFDFPLEARGNDEVSELTASFDRMRRSLQNAQQELLQAERLATIGRMASTVSHDLRHSLTAILAYAEFLSEGRLSEGRRVEFYQEIRTAVNQMTEQVSALLEFSKARAVYRPVQANLTEIIARAVRTVRTRPDFSRVQIVTTFDGCTEGWFDPGSLERVFHNLLLNACEAAPQDSGRVEVSARSTAEGLEIRVADNGGGIPESIRDTVFHPFVTSGKDNGTGLGLTVAQKIVQDHGGQVSVERTGAQGTVLRIFLPLAFSTSGIANQDPA